MSTFEEIAEALATRVANLEPDCYAGRDAARLTEVTARIERLAGTAKALLARRAADTGGWAAGSQALSAEQWLAGVSGISEHAARESLTTAERLDQLPAVAEHARAGDLSLTQATLVAAAATVDPASEHTLLRTARRTGHKGLRAETQRVLAAATDAEAAHARALKDRQVRHWANGVATDGRFSGPTSEWRKVLQALEPLEREAFVAARLDGRRESPDAYRWDALVALAERSLTGGEVAPTASKKARRVTRLRVDVARLLRDEPAAGEVCEIPGVGPVPVSVARAELPHGLLELVISDGVDVRTVVTATRHIPEALKVAIEERDPACKIDQCDRTDHLEGHHLHGFATHRRTSYDDVGNVCPEHHDLLTHRGYSVDVDPDGFWRLRAPPDQEVA